MDNIETNNKLHICKKRKASELEEIKEIKDIKEIEESQDIAESKEENINDELNTKIHKIMDVISKGQLSNIYEINIDDFFEFNNGFAFRSVEKKTGRLIFIVMFKENVSSVTQSFFLRGIISSYDFLQESNSGFLGEYKINSISNKLIRSFYVMDHTTKKDRLVLILDRSNDFVNLQDFIRSREKLNSTVLDTICFNILKMMLLYTINDIIFPLLYLDNIMVNSNLDVAIFDHSVSKKIYRKTYEDIELFKTTNKSISFSKESITGSFSSKTLLYNIGLIIFFILTGEEFNRLSCTFNEKLLLVKNKYARNELSRILNKMYELDILTVEYHIVEYYIYLIENCAWFNGIRTTSLEDVSDQVIDNQITELNIQAMNNQNLNEINVLQDKMHYLRKMKNIARLINKYRTSARNRDNSKVTIYHYNCYESYKRRIFLNYFSYLLSDIKFKLEEYKQLEYSSSDCFPCEIPDIPDIPDLMIKGYLGLNTYSSLTESERIIIITIIQHYMLEKKGNVIF